MANFSVVLYISTSISSNPILYTICTVMTLVTAAPFMHLNLANNTCSIPIPTYYGSFQNDSTPPTLSPSANTLGTIIPQIIPTSTAKSTVVSTTPSSTSITQSTFSTMPVTSTNQASIQDSQFFQSDAAIAVIVILLIVVVVGLVSRY